MDHIEAAEILECLANLQETAILIAQIDGDIEALTHAAKVLRECADAKTQWQPIETAPKDGRRIVVAGDCWVTEAYWNTHMEWLDGWGDSLTAEPTYWTDLPSASDAKIKIGEYM